MFICFLKDSRTPRYSMSVHIDAAVEKEVSELPRLIFSSKYFSFFGKPNLFTWKYYYFLRHFYLIKKSGY